MKKYCKCCGKLYEATPNRRVVCSLACLKNYKDATAQNKMFVQYCAECGKSMYDFRDRRFCSKDCREKAMQRDNNQSILDGDIKVDHITETMAYYKKLGLTYGEYQKMQTLSLMSKDKKK